MVCNACLEPIEDSESYLALRESFQMRKKGQVIATAILNDPVYAHYCCFIAYLGFEIENNAWVENVVNVNSPDSKAVRKIYDETMTIKCLHDWSKGGQQRKQKGSGQAAKQHETRT